MLSTCAARSTLFSRKRPAMLRSLVLARRIGEKSAAGEVVVVGRLNRRRTQVVVEHPDRYRRRSVTIGPDRGAEGVSTTSGAQDAVFAQDRQRRAVDRIRAPACVRNAALSYFSSSNAKTRRTAPASRALNSCRQMMSGSWSLDQAAGRRPTLLRVRSRRRIPARYRSSP